MKRLRTAAIIAAACASFSARSVAQGARPIVARGCSPSASQMKAAAAKLRSEQPDASAFVHSLDVAVGLDTEFISRHPASIVHHSDDLSVMVFFPYATYRLALTEALRKREPVGDIAVPSGVVIMVSPSRIDSPDILKVIVERDGKEIAPIANSLTPKPMQTRIGAKALLHAGEIVFPCAAFLPGARVHVIAIPASGRNIEQDIAPEDLLGYSPGVHENAASSLVGLAGTDVEKRIGKPDRVDGHLWNYGSGEHFLSLYLNDANIVTGVEPRMFDLSTIKK